MSQRTIVTCDECGTERKEANHWFSLIASASNPRLATFDSANRHPDAVTFRLDYCGQRCVTTAIQRWLDTGTVTDSAVATGTHLADMQNPQPIPRLITMNSR